MENKTNQKTNHRHKDTLFRTLFGDSRNFLELYNAVANENLPDGTEVTTYPSNELLAKFNDLAASVGNQLVVFFEHQLCKALHNWCYVELNVMRSESA